MQYELQIAGAKYLFVSQQDNDTGFLCVSICIFPAKVWWFYFFCFIFFLKQHLETIGKYWIFRKKDSAIQRIQMFWRNMPANSKILLDIMKATLTSLKSLYNGQRIKAVSTMQNKCASAGKRSDVWREPNFMSRWKFQNLFFWSQYLEIHWPLSNAVWKW